MNELPNASDLLKISENAEKRSNEKLQIEAKIIINDLTKKMLSAAERGATEIVLTCSRKDVYNLVQKMLKDKGYEVFVTVHDWETSHWRITWSKLI